MSSITKPMIAPKVAATTLSGLPIQAEKISSYEALDKPNARPDLGMADSYHILFNIFNEGSTTTKRMWTYSSSTARDADMVTLKAALATTLA